MYMSCKRVLFSMFILLGSTTCFASLLKAGSDAARAMPIAKAVYAQDCKEIDKRKGACLKK